MKFNKTPPPEYSPPGYVSAFYLSALLCLAAAVVFLLLSLKDGEIPYAAIGLFVAAGMNLFYGQMADALALTAWRTERLAYELQPVIDEILAQADGRERAERAATKAREDEIRRAVEKRLAGRGEV